MVAERRLVAGFASPPNLGRHLQHCACEVDVRGEYGNRWTLANNVEDVLE